MVWNITSISRLTLTFHLQLVLHPCDSFLITNRNMAGTSVKKTLFSCVDAIYKWKLDSKRFSDF